MIDAAPTGITALSDTIAADSMTDSSFLHHSPRVFCAFIDYKAISACESSNRIGVDSAEWTENQHTVDFDAYTVSDPAVNVCGTDAFHPSFFTGRSKKLKKFSY